MISSGSTLLGSDRALRVFQEYSRIAPEISLDISQAISSGIPSDSRVSFRDFSKDSFRIIFTKILAELSLRLSPGIIMEFYKYIFSLFLKRQPNSHNSLQEFH